MKKITLSVCSLLLVGSLFASPLQEENKAIAKRAFDEILSHGRYELTEQLYAKDFINHGIHTDKTLAEDQAALQGWREAFPNGVVVPLKLIAEDDLVAVYWIGRGTNIGAGTGPAAGKKVELSGIVIWRIVDGKIKEEWFSCDRLPMLQQLGLWPSET
jgi:predicted ester cyclase